MRWISTTTTTLSWITLLHFIIWNSANNNNIVDGFSILFMAAARRGQGKLQRALDDDDVRNTAASKQRTNGAAINQGKGQLVTGVTLPAEGTLKGWEFGDGVRLVCCNVNGKYYALQGECPRCGFDLYRGDLISNDAAWDDLPRVACPTCATTYSMRTGTYGPPIKRTGLQGFVTGLAKQSTNTAANKNAKAYLISVDDTDGKVYCRS